MPLGRKIDTTGNETILHSALLKGQGKIQSCTEGIF